MSDATSPVAHTVLLVEDEAHTRERLADVVRAHPSLRLLAAVGSCEDARHALSSGVPDVLLTDLGLPDGNGLDLIREVRRRGLGTQVMVITVFGDEEHVVNALEAGAAGYLLKDRSPEDIGQAILELVQGGSPISAAVARHLLRRFRSIDEHATTQAEPVPHLSEREQEILRLVVKGFKFPEIAELLGVSAHTVKTHVRRIYEKLEVSSRGEAVYEALQLGLVGVDE
jgi:DNA-binding NarL/FixJ family response regulator